MTVPSAGTETYTTPSTSNRLASISGAVNRSFTYAAAGQAVTDQRSPVDSWTYTIDEAGRMSAATLNGVAQATFAFDAPGQRIVKTNALTGAVTHYIYDAGGQLLAEMDGATGSRSASTFGSTHCPSAMSTAWAQAAPRASSSSTPTTWPARKRSPILPQHRLGRCLRALRRELLFTGSIANVLSFRARSTIRKPASRRIGTATRAEYREVSGERSDWDREYVNPYAYADGESTFQN